MTDWPITLQEAAKKIHASERWLRGHLKMNPSGRKSGRRIIFTERDFEHLLNSLEPIAHRNRSIAGLKPAPSGEKAVEMVRRKLIDGKQRAMEKQRRRRSNCNV